jgi:hypothetical protein
VNVLQKGAAKQRVRSNDKDTAQSHLIRWNNLRQDVNNIICEKIHIARLHRSCKTDRVNMKTPK